MSSSSRDPDELARASADVMWRDDAATRGLGITLDQVSPGASRLSMTVLPSMVNGLSIAHGGYVSLLADSAMAFASNSHGEVAVAAGFDVMFVAPAHEGDRLVATATERLRAGRSGVYDVTVVRTGADGTSGVVAEFRGRTRSTGRPIGR